MDSNNNNILSALDAIDPAGLSYQEWLSVGMGLHSEGQDCSVWESWSRSDKRYHPGECERKWRSFRGSASPVTAGTIFKMARDRGWKPPADATFITNDKWDQTGQLITYLEALFRPGDIVGYVTSDVWKNNERWAPAKGVYTRTAGEIIAALKANRNDISAAVGEWQPEAGAWIRFNPLDGKGVRNDNVTRYDFALVESDDMPVEEQERLYRRLQLPIACMVHSGGKSLHAIVRVDAKNAEEYRTRVDYLYSYLEKNGLPVDKQNRNPSRLSRMPGVTRNGRRQYLAAVNIGMKSWDDWIDYFEAESDGLPQSVKLGQFRNNRPQLPPELISGVLRCGHKMLISGPSKAGKSFLLMELCIALAEGGKWLGFDCRKSRVMYVNLEIDPASCIHRFMNIYEAMGINDDNIDDIEIWNLRGKALPLDQLVPKLVRRLKQDHFDAVVIDPIYKVITGDENNATDMGRFCNQFDAICERTGCSVIYCHHHSKGAQGAKKAQDRASGSGVFARDPDAQLDIIELELTEDIKNFVRDGNATAWRMEGSLREFAGFKPVDFWFDHPIHRIDEENLTESYPAGNKYANLAKSGKRTSAKERKNMLDTAFQLCSELGEADINDMADYIGISNKSVRRYINEFNDLYVIHNGVVTLCKTQ